MAPHRAADIELKMTEPIGCLDERRTVPRCGVRNANAIVSGTESNLLLERRHWQRLDYDVVELLASQNLTLPSDPVLTFASIPATLIPGDGIGPEITAAVVEVLDALGKPFVWDVQQGGMAAVEKTGDPLPPALLDSIRRTRLALKGPLTTPIGGGYRSVNVRLREEFKLYANLRPARTLISGGRYEDIDIVLVRENLEGFYIGFEHYIPIDGDPQAAAISSGINTRAGSRRVAEFAFDYALKARAEEV